MSESFTSVWDDAGDNAEAEQSLRALTAARVQAGRYWPFLAAATSRQDFVNRLALKDAEIEAAAASQGITFEALCRSLAEDFYAIEAARVIAADDSSAYYVVDGDSGKKVGGPYDSKEDAQAAISGGDVEGDNLSVSKGDSDSDDDSDDEGDSDDESSPDPDEGGEAEGGENEKENPFAKKESALTAQADAEHVCKTSDGKPIQLGMKVIDYDRRETTVTSPPKSYDLADPVCHPERGHNGHWWGTCRQDHEHKFGENGCRGGTFDGSRMTTRGVTSARKTAHNDAEVSQAARESNQPPDHPGFRSGVGSYDTAQAPGPNWRPHRIYDSVGSALNHHGGPVEGDMSGLAEYNHCPGCDNVYSTGHPQHETVGSKDKCPNCGDTDFHESVPDLAADDRSHRHAGDYFDEPHSEDNYGDPYGKMDSYHDFMRNAAKTAGHDVEVSNRPNCDICKYDEGKTTPADYDSRLPKHPQAGSRWANVCQRHFDQYGPGTTGTGDAQRLLDRKASKTATLFPVIALQDGEDPLEWVEESVPSGEGEPEKPDEHREDIVLTGSLVDKFRQVFTAHIKQ